MAISTPHIDPDIEPDAYGAAHFLDEIPWAQKSIRQAEERLTLAVRRAHAAGATWQRIGDALGVTRQAAQRRFGPSS